MVWWWVICQSYGNLILIVIITSKVRIFKCRTEAPITNIYLLQYLGPPSSPLILVPSLSAYSSLSLVVPHHPCPSSCILVIVISHPCILHHPSSLPSWLSFIGFIVLKLTLPCCPSSSLFLIIITHPCLYPSSSSLPPIFLWSLSSSYSTSFLSAH